MDWRIRWPRRGCGSHAESPLLAAFRELSDHPRFGEIRDWHKDLAPLLYSRGLDWFGKEKIVGVLARDRRSYVHLESVLFRARDWEHRNMDEIEMLDKACERLFAETD